MARPDTLPRSFFERPVLEVAPDLLGAVFVLGPVAVRLTEVEAYDGANDPASHAYRGLTPRTTVMFGPPGHLYVYFTYGMHHCANLVCGPDGTASAVLLRAGEVMAGLEQARSHRPGVVKDTALARGPANLVRALGLGPEHNGVDVVGGGPVRIRAGTTERGEIRTGPRVGVSTGSTRPWRFWLGGDPTVSAYRAGTRRQRGAVR
ncbi:DNA-3-methyladenine glycosylase [Sporichthya sp.]|uniref:DNA-3-methyladenine glycosylase n=1 Tax=Sporichthya sp. TaxID=65475 RepID=UPI0018014C2A|nr:DNA-3-methyladenine glycosylase [Sporichthya sp.]MBA3742013.1 DNA-3-methyladenine glycosylase [Sporichthya sp.]